MTVLNNRAIKDNSSCKWGSLKVEKDDTGKFIKAELYPQNTKKDDGTSLGAQQGASKRPVILPVENKQKCFFTFYRIYEDQRRRLSDKFGKDLLHPDSPFFLIPKEKRLFDKSDGILFKPKGMGPQHFKNLVFNMAIDSGLNILGRKITNTSLRVAAFHMQENIGIDAVTGRQFSGHVNPGTAATYRRKNKETSNKVGGALVEAFTGSLAIHPENCGKSLTKDLPLI
ncbi:uncharacterized protein LOC111709216 [Eurytemora carolleeae]|uniref:uncharacterized protein LOC111709216 n=1 Tax=Eurytemora carolleeae TaxID=1294199 RepID=UPI000C764D00|nr:uncharacterized protein LOC111709216 [Eurytemora carolleeae]|eukprot:XP_023338599.1 uncharacterized protein LOC111709216 [Eurytemora affinis]